MWACTGSPALRVPAVGLLQGIGVEVMKGGSLLKYSVSPAEFEGYPVLPHQGLGGSQARGPEGNTLGSRGGW